MNKTIRKTATILAHIGLLLSILYLVFFIVCSIRAQSADPSGAAGKDLYLKQAMSEHDFSVYTVGKALSDESDPARENLFVALDLAIPILCLASGVLLQLASVRKKRIHAAQQQPIQSTKTRR